MEAIKHIETAAGTAMVGHELLGSDMDIPITREDQSHILAKLRASLGDLQRAIALVEGEA